MSCSLAVIFGANSIPLTRREALELETGENQII